jgi:hypothetical protein
MGRPKLITKYMPFINAVMKDLGIEDCLIDWCWANYNAAFKGRCSWPEGRNQKYHKITLKRLYHSDKLNVQLYETIAHELRHVYQMQNKLLVPSSTGVIWNGSSHSYKRRDTNYVTHRERPEELDAYSYADYAVKKFKRYIV